MTNQHRWRALVAISALSAMALAGCKGEDTTTNPNSGNPSGVTSGGAKAPGGGEAAASAAFDKPLKPEGPITLQVLTNGMSPFWDAMGKGLEQEKAALKIEATWKGPDPADNSTQKQFFENALSANVNGIAVSPIEADAFAPVIDSAIAKGVPVITFDSDSPKSRRLAYIGTNNYEAGRRAGEAAVKLFPSGGRLVAFVGNMSAQNARDRFNGFMDAVKGHNIEMLQDPYEDNKDAGKARQNVAEAITKFGDKINGFLGLYSYNGPAIVDEVMNKNLRSKVKIICFDGEPKTLDNLGKGLVDVTVVQKPFEFGRLSAQLLTHINRKGLKAALETMKPELEKAGMTLKNNIIDTGVEVITPENAAPFLKKLKDMGLSST